MFVWTENLHEEDSADHISPGEVGVLPYQGVNLILGNLLPNPQSHSHPSHPWSTVTRQTHSQI